MKDKITLKFKDNIIVLTYIPSDSSITYITQIPIKKIKSIEYDEDLLAVIFHMQCDDWENIYCKNKTQAKQFMIQIRKWLKEYHKEMKNEK